MKIILKKERRQNVKRCSAERQTGWKFATKGWECHKRQTMREKQRKGRGRTLLGQEMSKERWKERQTDGRRKSGHKKR